MKNVASFQSERFPIPQVEEEESPGRQIAEELCKGLTEEGGELKRDSPVEGEGGWSIWLVYTNYKWKLFLNTVGMGEPTSDYWLLGFQSRGKEGILGFLRRPSEEKQKEFRSLLADQLDRLDARKVRWWSQDEITQAVVGPRSRNRT